jgi:hypothetical protein
MSYEYTGKNRENRKQIKKHDRRVIEDSEKVARARKLNKKRYIREDEGSFGEDQFD